MTKTYELEGMSCGGCANTVKNALLNHPHVTRADVQLHPQSVILTTSEAVNVGELQAQLSRAEHYRIREAVLI